MKATDLGVALRMRQADPSHSASERAVSRRRILKATGDPVAFRPLKTKAMVSGVLVLVEIANSGVHMVCVYVVSSTTPTVVISPVGYPSRLAETMETRLAQTMETRLVQTMETRGVGGDEDKHVGEDS
ncbi:hypothetical protein Taro_046903 [Colocasia esculenta]|uniref:Uncharacterized protein n=1 Tax=Colocasia esculenta TaxID=4460 RepID=A0A843WZT3_COLES|nr:hypothetical protein [Colocasia esculenta]